mmetsp:Transcript_23057/g.16389  ORF Transcript_23057/g.16389 Transcript_23057/m.16389 type:complete len:106 (+) Transcript_23057:437-754(+)
MYVIFPYYFAKMITESPALVMMPVIENFLTYFAVGFRPSFECFFQFTLVFMLTTQVGTALGYFISSLFDNVNSATQVTPFAVMPFIMFGGYAVNLSTVPGYISWF